ncbi:MAG: response regulator [Oscillospiraceae bacterium]|nr:response regulator [Oscillospiraceae bacterium]
MMFVVFIVDFNKEICYTMAIISRRMVYSMKCISILLVEDDKETCEEFENYISTRNDVRLIATTSSSEVAVDVVKTQQPAAIILDIQLPDGTGSGYNFLADIQALDLPYSPIIAVNTSLKNKRMYEKLSNECVDFIYYKHQKGYSVKSVIDDIVFLGSDNSNDDVIENQPIIKEILDDRNKRIDEMIKIELDAIGINYTLIGSGYLYDCLVALLQDNINPNYSVFQHVAKKYAACSNTIGRSIQTLINDTWKKSSIEHLRENYTARINYNTGVPTPMEFVYYYYEKIKKAI